MSCFSCLEFVGQKKKQPELEVAQQAATEKFKQPEAEKQEFLAKWDSLTGKKLFEAEVVGKLVEMAQNQNQTAEEIWPAD